MAWLRLSRALVALGALTLLGLAVAPPARADVVLLVNGARLVGQVEPSPLSILTGDGVVQAAPADLSEIRLGTVGGDVASFRTGRAVVGLVDQPRYSVRLPSGQTVIVERQQIALIRFGR